MKLMFFAPDFTDPQIQDQLDAIRPYASNMLAFFTMDEPDCVAGGNSARLDQLLSSIESQISQLKLSFPDVPMMMTVGCAFWSYSNFRIPNGIDYIAIESYGSSGDPATTAIESGGENLLPVAPSAEASRGVLRSEAGFTNADTVEVLLQCSKLQEQVRGQVIWIDEAGLLGARTLGRVAALAEKQNCRVKRRGTAPRFSCDICLTAYLREHASLARAASSPESLAKAALCSGSTWRFTRSAAAASRLLSPFLVPNRLQI